MRVIILGLQFMIVIMKQNIFAPDIHLVKAGNAEGVADYM